MLRYCPLIVFILPLFCYSQIDSKKQFNFVGELLLNDDLVDFNKDGILDYFIQDFGGTFYYKAYGDGRFGDIVLLDGVFERYLYEIKDVDNDEDLDIIGFEMATNTIVINFNQGFHIFSSKRYEIENSSLLSYFTSVDIDGDGFNEIIATYYNENNVYLFKIVGEKLVKSTLATLNKPNRISSMKDKNGPQIIIQYDGTKFQSFSTDASDNIIIKENGSVKSELFIYQMLDINKDSIADLLTTTNYQAFLRLGNTDGVLLAEKNIGEVSLSTSYDIFDVDNDSDLDLVFPRATEFTFTLCRNTGNGVFISEQVDFDEKTKNIQLIQPDLGLIDGELVKNPLTSFPSSILQIHETNPYYHWAINFDVDEDGDVDILANSGIRDKLTFFENIDGHFVKSKILDRPFSNSSTLFTDVDNDGKLDILFISNNQLTWFRNQGGGNFSASISLGTISTANSFSSFFQGDFNGDGLQDLGIVSEKDQVFWIAKIGNAYNLTPNIVFNYTGATDRACFYYPLDFDNDGDNDIISADGYGGIDFFENMNGFFSGHIKTIWPGYGTSGLNFIDVNNDGYQDILRLYHNGTGKSFIMLLINGKNNTLVNKNNIASTGFAHSFILVDLNKDGLLDISVIEEKDNRLIWFFNQGNGSFSDPLVADHKVGSDETDAYNDYHQYFFLDENDPPFLTMVVDDILFISEVKDFSNRYDFFVSNEKCNQNSTTLVLDDDFKSFELLPFDFNDPTASYSIHLDDESWSDVGIFGKNKMFSLPKGSAGSGDKTIIIKNSSNQAIHSFVIKDDMTCFDTTGISDLDALMIFHHETNGKNWTDNSIFRGNKWKDMYVRYIANQIISSVEYCALPGVTCINNNVVQIKIEAKNLSGKLSEALSFCRYLETLDLSSNAITSMPSSMKSFRSLKILDLFGNDLVGVLPDDIGACTNLITLDVGANELSGTIPSSITKLTKLEKFILGGGGAQVNKISGTIPDNIGNMISLKEINFGGQPLTGILPESFGNLKQLETVWIVSTKVGGKLPSSLSNIMNPKLKTLNLNNNTFVDCIPNSYKVFCSLPTFSIRYSSVSSINSVEFCASNKHNCYQDNDMDGFPIPEDCNDNDATINADAMEVDFNDVDENCDGVLDFPCHLYNNQSHNTFESALNLCSKQSGRLHLYQDGNRSIAVVPCFEDISSYSAVWQKFKIYKEGSLYFSIRPTDDKSEVDFALFKIANPNDKTTLELVRCGRSTCDGEMGLSEFESDIHESDGCEGVKNNFLSDIDVKAGAYYALLILERNNKKVEVDVAICGSSLLGETDQICNEIFYIFDNDGDGFNNIIDCNDDNPAINQGAVEILFNDIDENCDGIAELPCIDRNNPLNDFSSFDASALICTKEKLTYQNGGWGKDVRYISCDGDNFYMQSYVTVQKIKILKGGSFYFTITPNDPNETVSFGVYKTTDNFKKSTLSMIRCCLTSLHLGDSPGSFGLSPFEQDEQEGAYEIDLSKGKNGFVKSIDAHDGDEYTIYTNSFKHHLSLTTTYCGTASFVYDNTVCIATQTTNLKEDDLKLVTNIVSEYLPYSSNSNTYVENVKIIDLNGRLIHTRHQDNAVDVSQLPAGVYFCQFKTSSKFIYKKFIKI